MSSSQRDCSARRRMSKESEIECPIAEMRQLPAENPERRTMPPRYHRPPSARTIYNYKDGPRGCGNFRRAAGAGYHHLSPLPLPAQFGPRRLLPLWPGLANRFRLGVSMYDILGFIDSSPTSTSTRSNSKQSSKFQVRNHHQADRSYQ